MSNDPSAFIVNERAREYVVVIDVEVEMRLYVEADSENDARHKAKSIIDRDEYELDIDPDDVMHTRISSVRKRSPMFLVTRNGVAMQVSHLEDGDEPGQPNEFDF